ncbi:MAG: hypothetical protein R2876_02535 [Eubacteriales bacterium]
MFKKSLSLLLTILVLMCFCSSAYADTTASNDTAKAASNVSGDTLIGGGGLIQPMWVYTFTTFNWMDINGSGQAAMVSNMTAYNGIDQVKMNNYLQKYDNGAWKTVKNWSATYPGTYGYWSKTYYVVSGYNYRLKTYFYAYEGDDYEVTTLTSGTVYY